MKFVPPITSIRMVTVLETKPHQEPGGAIAEGAGSRADRAVGEQTEQLHPVACAPTGADPAVYVPLGLSGSSLAHLLGTEPAAYAGDP